MLCRYLCNLRQSPSCSGALSLSGCHRNSSARSNLLCPFQPMHPQERRGKFIYSRSFTQPKAPAWNPPGSSWVLENNNSDGADLSTSLWQPLHPGVKEQGPRSIFCSCQLLAAWQGRWWRPPLSSLQMTGAPVSLLSWTARSIKDVSCSIHRSRQTQKRHPAECAAFADLASSFQVYQSSHCHWPYSNSQARTTWPLPEQRARVRSEGQQL